MKAERILKKAAGYLLVALFVVAPFLSMEYYHDRWGDVCGAGYVMGTLMGTLVVMVVSGIAGFQFLKED